MKTLIIIILIWSTISSLVVFFNGQVNNSKVSLLAMIFRMSGLAIALSCIYFYLKMEHLI